MASSVPSISQSRPADPQRRRFLKTAALATAVATVPALSACTTGEKQYDVVIRNGRVYDGSPKGDWTTTDIAVKDGKILAMGEKIQGPAAKTIDATGLWVVPGFIDVHTHCDLTFMKSGWKRHLAWAMPSWKGNYNYLYQGVTTVVTGNCGLGYDDTEAWLSHVDRLSFGSNVAHLVPHGMIRSRISDRPELTFAQRDQLRGRVAEELDKGAVGLSVGLEYAPGIHAPTRELIELCREVEGRNRVFTTHMRDESGTVTGPGRFGILDALEETLTIARETGVNTQISHFKLSAPMNGLTAEQILAPIRRGREAGLSLHADQYPYDAGSTVLSYLLPPEYKALDGITEAARTSAGRKAIQAFIPTVFAHLPPEKILITINPEDTDCEGLTLAQIAQRKNQAPAHTFTDLVCQDQCPFAVFFAQDMDMVRALMPNDFVLTASDGWTVPKDMTHPHPRTYGTFPRKLKQFVQEEGRMDILDALYSMTGLPATKFNLKGRGFLKPGYHADMALLDPAAISAPATYLAPHAYARGVVHVLVNGVHALETGSATGDRGGRGLRTPA